MSKTAIILGSNSDIAKGLMPLLERDGWQLKTWARGHSLPMFERWDLLINCIGAVAPVGLWNAVDIGHIENCFESNFLLPIRAMKLLWSNHNPGASICFLAGSNPNTIMKGYFAYNVSKMALLKAVEQMDAESPDAKFFALGPGTILTKIHKATLDAKWDNPKLAAVMEKEMIGFATMEKMQRVYDCLKWCIAQPKEVIGGRNICASDPWHTNFGGALNEVLERDPHMFKLRRSEWGE